MSRRIATLITLLLLAGAFLAPRAYPGQTSQSEKDFQSAAELLKAGKLTEALALINKVIVQAEGEGGAAGMEAKSKPGQLKKISTMGRLAREYLSDVPRVLRIGMRMFGSRWRLCTALHVSPFECAVRT